MTLRMRDPAPSLDLGLAGGGRFRLGERPPKAFTLVVFYRGLHCHRCNDYLNGYQALLDDFAKLGVEVVAVSSDSQERAEQSKRDWKLSALAVGYGLSIEAGRAWGLFISRGVRSDEPAIFTEPALYVIDRDGKLVFGVINSVTRMRPPAADVLGMIERVAENRDSARGDA